MSIMCLSGKFLSARTWADKSRLFRSTDSYHRARSSHSRTKLPLKPVILLALPDRLRCGEVIARQRRRARCSACTTGVHSTTASAVNQHLADFAPAWRGTVGALGHFSTITCFSATKLTSAGLQVHLSELVRLWSWVWCLLLQKGASRYNRAGKECNIFKSRSCDVEGCIWTGFPNPVFSLFLNAHCTHVHLFSSCFWRAFQISCCSKPSIIIILPVCLAQGIYRWFHLAFLLQQFCFGGVYMTNCYVNLSCITTTSSNASQCYLCSFKVSSPSCPALTVLN